MNTYPPLSERPEASVRNLMRDIQNPPIAIRRSSIETIRQMRLSQRTYFKYRNGSEIPRMRLLELDVDRILERLPEDGKQGDIAYILPEDVQLLRNLRDIQKRFVKDKASISIGEACVLETKVDALIKRLRGETIEEAELPFWAGLEDE